MSKFSIDKRYNRISVDFNFDAQEWDKIYDWCNSRPEYDAYATSILYREEKDLTAFLLRWA